MAKPPEEDLQRAQGLIAEVVALVGEEGLAEVVANTADMNLRDALIRLRSTAWWIATLRDAIVTPQQFNTQLLCKLVDKAVPTPQSIKIGADDGFKLVIEHVQAKEEPK